MNEFVHCTLQGTRGLVCWKCVDGLWGRRISLPALKPRLDSPLRLTSCTRQRGSGQGETWRRRGMSYLYRAPCELPHPIKSILSLLLFFFLISFRRECNQKKRTFFRLDPFQIMTQAENIARLCVWPIQLFPISFTRGSPANPIGSLVSQSMVN